MATATWKVDRGDVEPYWLTANQVARRMLEASKGPSLGKAAATSSRKRTASYNDTPAPSLARVYTRLPVSPPKVPTSAVVSRSSHMTAIWACALTLGKGARLSA